MAERYSAAELLEPLCEMLEITTAEVLARAGLPPDWLQQPISSVGPDNYFRIWEAVRAVSARLDFELYIGRTMAHGPFSPPIFAFSCSETVALGFDRLAIFKPLIGPTRIAVKREEAGLRLDISFASGSIVAPHGYELMELIFKVECVRAFTGHPVRPLALSVSRDLPCPPDVVDYLGAPVGAGKVSMLFSHEDADRRLVTRSPALWESLEPALNRQLAADLPVTTRRVREALEHGLPGGASTLDEIARRLHLSKRSLQRRLLDEGAQFQAILNDVRQEQAKHYLRGSALSLQEISHLLGYRDTASFFRAFQSWTGTTPAAYRKAA